jgi:trimeric autotransporter adhesin
MKPKFLTLLALTLAFSLQPSALLFAAPLGTAFTYQGKLANGTNAANGSHDLKFTLYDALSTGSVVAGPLTNSPVAVTNGLFTVFLDFGGNVFDGNARWLEIGVRTNGDTGDFTLLSPRQELTAGPYAVYAPTAGTAATVTGNVSASQLTGTITDARLSANVALRNAGNTFAVGPQTLQAGTGISQGLVIKGAPNQVANLQEWQDGAGMVVARVSPAGSFQGDGAGLANLNAINLASGTVPDSRLSANVARTNQVWLLNGNAGTTAGTHFLGTTDNQPLEFKVNNQRVLRLELAAGGPNVVGGYGGNGVSAGVVGATISGGGAPSFMNSVGADHSAVGGGRLNRVQGGASFSTIGGGGDNLIQTNAYDSTVAGGYWNTIGVGAANSAIGGGWHHTIDMSAHSGTVGGGYENSIQTNAYMSTISGGAYNTIQTNASTSTVSGGYHNNIATYSSSATIAGGYYNGIGSNSGSSTIAGGYANNITANSVGASIAGGYYNDIGTNSTGSSIGGGLDNNIAENSGYATIGGGEANDIAANSGFSAIAGGVENNIAANSWSAVIAGGQYNGVGVNSASSAIGGGYSNKVNATFSSVGGGANNLINNMAQESFIGGGHENAVQSGAQYSTIGGGYRNRASGVGAFVGGGGHDGSLTGGNVASGAASVIGGGVLNTASGNWATVAGGLQNTCAMEAAVGGGTLNTAGGYGAFVGSGYRNNASGMLSTVAGGNTNTASGYLAAVGGGNENLASAEGAAVGGGCWNSATNTCAAVPGGTNNVAGGRFSFAAGRQAKALHNGAFVWGDSTGADIASTNANSVTLRASGGYRLFSDTNTTAGTYLAPGGGSWTSISDRNAKENVQAVDARSMLAKVAALPLSTWNYKSQDPAVRHIGPMAQDFKATFVVGESDTGITTVDADGVALAAIQGLNQKVEEREAMLRAENLQLKQEVGELKRLVNQLSAKLNGGAQ